MVGTREQLEAYSYESRRRATSFLLGEDRATQDPRRRLARVTVGSVIVGVLALAAFGVAGFLGAGSGSALPDQGAVIVPGTGEAYVVIDGTVHPALNLASALLVGGGSLTEVKASALDGHPRGLPVGIPGAPSGLPAAGHLTHGAWSVCLVPPESSAVPPELDLFVGVDAAPPGALPPGQAVVAASPDGATWLLTGGRRFQLAGNTQVLLGLGRSTPLPVPAQVLDTVPAGPPIQPPAVDGAGGTSAGGLGAVGDLARAQAVGVPTQYFAVEPDGLAAVSELTYDLLAASGGHVRDVAPAAAAAAPRSARQAPGERAWPDTVPSVPEPRRGQPLCVTTAPGAPAGDTAWQVTLSTPPSVPAPAGLPAVTAAEGRLPGGLSSVHIGAGGGALVSAVTSTGQDGALTLVTDSGQRYGLPSADAAGRLHYAANAADRVPWPFVSLLPAGPVLDPAAAAEESAGTH